jgi:GT2 family glycosyltransferase
MENVGRLSVIILMHDNISISRHCLDLLSSALADLDHEVILLDNASAEDTRPMLDNGNIFQHFRMIRSEDNIPFSAGNNQAASAATGQWLLFLNNDVFVRPDTVKQMLHTFSDKDAGIAGGKLLFPGDAAVQHAGIGQMLWGYPSNYGVGAKPSDPRIQLHCERFALSGAMLCLPRKIFQQIGGFDERYVWGMEDIDLCLKVRSMGYRVAYNPDSVATHMESATLKLTQGCEWANNYTVFREVWDPILTERENDYIRGMVKQGIRRVAIVGTGMAASGLARIFGENGIQIVAFTSTTATDESECFLGRPLVPLAALSTISFDRLFVASQFFFEIEPLVQKYDPVGDPIYPLLA